MPGQRLDGSSLGHDPAGLVRAEEISRRHRGLRLGLVDSVVMRWPSAAGPTRSRPSTSVTGAVTLRGRPRLEPRDIG